MLTQFHLKEYATYSYRFLESRTTNVAQLCSVGWDKAYSSLDNWNNNLRKDTGKYLFKYTVSGYGTLTIGGKEYKVDAGKAFLINKLDDYYYYFPKESENWEFIFLTLSGDEVNKCWNYIQSAFQPIIRFHPESSPIQLLTQIYKCASEKSIMDPFHASSLSYGFVMELYQYVKSMDAFTDDWPESIIRSILFARNYYHKEIGPDEMAESANLSRYHFSRLFKQTTRLTPIQYLTKLRIEKAADLLNQTRYSIEEIAENVGYANANYLTKVFRKTTTMTPGQYRKKSASINEHFILPE
ncbi:AraC family transcriptional regulator [Priestia megaterium]|nr:AraC family transcriptional regulator [Priestia megaterium]